MKAIRFIRLYTIWVLAFAILLRGLWIDGTTEIDMFPTSMFTIPLFVILLIIGIIYHYIEIYIKNGIFFYLKEMSFLYIICFGLWVLGLLLIDNLGFRFPLLIELFSPLKSKLAFYLLIITQLTAIVIFIITIIRKKDR